LPELFAVVVALAAPLSVTVAPEPFAAGLTVPEMLYVVGDPVEAAVKFTAETLAPLTLTGELAGLKLNPLLPGVTAYEPLARPVKA
jgi:hypothetical protein